MLKFLFFSFIKNKFIEIQIKNLGPRKMTIVIPKMNNESRSRMECKPTSGNKNNCKNINLEAGS